MVKTKREDTVIRVSKWLDEAIEKYLSDRRVRLRYPSKRNFVDQAIIKFLEENKFKLGK